MIGQLALICAAVFVGAAVFVTVAEQPARLALDDRAMLLEWQRSYNRAAPMQAGLAMVSALLGYGTFRRLRPLAPRLVLWLSIGRAIRP
jgi:hypothetical protein